MKRLLLLNFFLILCLVQSVFAQEKTVTGVVTDKQDNAPLPGVSVIVTGTKTGTQTDANGHFTIRLSGGQNQITVSYIGYTAQTVAVASGTMQITLVPNASELSEVVVTGVGTATDKRKVAIDVATLSSQNFAKSVVNGSAEQMLTGQIAGATIKLDNGQPGAGAAIQLRGINTLGSSYPMILVDGVQTTDLNGLDPSLIDRVEVVKGAAAGMLYGAQGANGVLQVFTKKGARNSAPSINFSSRYSNDRILRGTNDLLATYHHYQTDADGYVLDVDGNRIQRSEVGQWTEPDPMLGNDVTNSKPYRETIFNHLDQAYRVANTFNNSLSISGGGEKVDYSASVSRLDQQNVMNNTLNRTTAGLNLGVTLAKNLTFRSTTQAIFNYEDLISGNRFPLLNSYQWIDFKFRDPIGNLVFQPKEENQINSLAENEWHDRYNRYNRLVENLNLNYKFNRFVELDAKLGTTAQTTRYHDFYRNQNGTLQTGLYFGSTRDGQIAEGYERRNYTNFLGTVYFRTDFQKDFASRLPITTSTQLSYDARRNKFNSYYTAGAGLPEYPPYNLNVAITKSNSSYDEEALTYGILANQVIDFGNLFGVSAGVRTDYASAFGAGSKSFTFPRGTAYFNPSELLHLTWLPQWKLRGAYGEAGTPPQGPYDRQNTLAAGALGDGSYLSLQDQARNPDLLVQRSSELEVGTDAVFSTQNTNWLNRISLTATYWKRTSDDVIQNAQVAPSTGFTGLISNLMALKSNGVELTIDANMLSAENLKWNFGVRFAHTVTRVSKIAGGQEIVTENTFSLREGERIGIFYGQVPLSSISQARPDGSLYIPAEEAGNYEIVNGFVTNRETKQVVVTGSDDKRKIGDPNPKFTMSFINSFNFFRDLSLSFQFDWTQGNQIYNLTRQWLYRDRLAKDFDTPITVNGQTGAYINYYSSLYNSVNPISWFIENGNFVRLRDVSLTYNLTRIVKAPWAKNLSVTLSGRNLATFTKYKGLDPESTSSGQITSTTNTLSRGVDNFGFPNLKSYQFGINVGL
ncbi:MAG: SusC/RagA family TonB-linked outer membrane protein [Mucilaginibacter polytrichastri]|nr:SusC/RagA family TonB-linked outer membrane protein [Mucilaginibacter polytrichastri]